MSLPQKAVIESVLIGVISTLFVLLLTLVPVLNAVVLLWPVPLIIVGVRRGLWAGVLSLVVSGLLIALILQPLAGLVLIITHILFVIALSLGFRRRLDLFEMILLSAGSVLVSLMAFIKGFSFIAGYSAFDALWQSVRDVITNGGVDFNQLLGMYHQMGLFQNFTTDLQLAEYLISQVQLAVPAALMIFSLVYGVLVFLVARIILKRFRYEVVSVPAFADWALPRGMGFGFLVLLLVAYLGTGLRIHNFQVVQLTITSLVSFIFTVQGLAVLWFFLKAGRVPSVLRWLLVVFIYVVVHMMLTLNMGLTFVGIFDQVVNLRRNYRNRFAARK